MGEEEATMREELVEAIGGAIAKAWNSTDPEAAMLPPIDLTGSERDVLASFALDAALDVLETPSEEMVEAGEMVGVQPFVPAGQFTAMTFTAMLATLRSPKI